MADPSIFTPGFDYSGYEASNPTDPKPGDELDIDFAAIETSIGELVGAVKDVRRSDGELKNGIVTLESLAPDVAALIGANDDLETVSDNIAAITTVAGIDSGVTTVAGIDSDVTTVAGIDSDVTTVAGIDSDVTTVATNVADVTNFADVYLGAAASDPSTRNDGSALQAGDLYFNTADDRMNVWTGSGWIYAGSFVAPEPFDYPGDGSTTDFTLPKAPDSKYALHVFVSGVYQPQSSYSVSGTTLSFSEAPPAPPDGVTNNINGILYSLVALGGTGANLVTYGGDTVNDALDDLFGRTSVSVFEHGATGSGDETAEFQAAIDALPAAGGHIVLETGVDYTVTAASLTPGTKTVVWVGDGIINGSGNFNQLPGVTVGINRNAGANPTGQIIINRNDVAADQGAALRLRTVADYDSGGATSGVTKTLEARRDVGADASNSNWAALFEVVTDQTDPNARSLASYHKITKTASAQGRVWGLAISAISESTVDTQIVGCELNARAIGSMGGNSNRIVVNAIASTVEDEAKSDWETVINVVVNGTSSGGVTGTFGDLTADSKYGVKIHEESPGQITNAGVFIETTGSYGLHIQGTQTASGIQFDGAAIHGIDFTGGTFSGSAIRVGDDQQVRFGNDTDYILDYTAGTDVFDISRGAAPHIRLDSSATDPVRIFVNSALQRVTAGASDSGGTGFRALRVPN